MDRGRLPRDHGAGASTDSAGLVAVSPGGLCAGARRRGDAVGLVPDAAGMARQSPDSALWRYSGLPEVPPLLPRPDPGRHHDRLPLGHPGRDLEFTDVHVLPRVAPGALFMPLT